MGKLWSLFRQFHKLNRKEKVLIVHWSHNPGDEPVSRKRNLDAWKHETEKSSSCLFKYRKEDQAALEMQWFAFLVYFMAFTKWEILLATPSSIFSQDLIYFCFYSHCSSKGLVARRGSEDLFCSSSCGFYSLHFKMGKQNTSCGTASV